MVLKQLTSLFSAASADVLPAIDVVNSRGVAWSGDGFGTSFNRVRDHAGIVHVDLDSGKTSANHIHDLQGTFCTKPLRAGLSNEEVWDGLPIRSRAFGVAMSIRPRSCGRSGEVSGRYNDPFRALERAPMQLGY